MFFGKNFHFVLDSDREEILSRFSVPHLQFLFSVLLAFFVSLHIYVI